MVLQPPLRTPTTYARTRHTNQSSTTNDKKLPWPCPAEIETLHNSIGLASQDVGPRKKVQRARTARWVSRHGSGRAPAPKQERAPRESNTCGRGESRTATEVTRLSRQEGPGSPYARRPVRQAALATSADRATQIGPRETTSYNHSHLH